jgi:hypothetical protein
VIVRIGSSVGPREDLLGLLLLGIIIMTYCCSNCCYYYSGIGAGDAAHTPITIHTLECCMYSGTHYPPYIHSDGDHARPGDAHLYYSLVLVWALSGQGGMGQREPGGHSVQISAKRPRKSRRRNTTPPSRRTRSRSPHARVGSGSQ